MFNANMNPDARVPRNALCVWQSNETIARLTGRELTVSLRRCLPSAKTNAVHPKDWPSMSAGVVRYIAEFEKLTPSQQAMVESWQS